jgi:predicted AAA+ superfamily ATPase
VRRAPEQALSRLLEIFPVVVVTGARQTGKSTLVSEQPELQGRLAYTLDDLDVRTQAQADPAAFVARDTNLVIDEVQRVPELLLAIKAQVDAERQRTKGRFVLTGSANLLMMKQVADSLAGRAAYLNVVPLTRRELLGQATTGRWSQLFDLPFDDWLPLLQADESPPEDWRAAVTRGGFPVPALQLTADQRPSWFNAYIATYLERDLRDLATIELLGDFRQTMRALALRIGNPVNQSEIARDLGIGQRNISRWIDLLKTSWMVTELPAFSLNRTSRLMKRPKLYWNDPALALTVAGEMESSGAHLENLVLSDLLAWAAVQPTTPEVMYWRTTDNAEVDFVLQRGRSLLAVEVKATTNPGFNDYKTLTRFVGEYTKDCHGALLLHCGTETVRLSDRVVATPWWRVL